MKVAQIIPSLSQNSGGPSRSVYELTRGLRSIGVDSVILTNNYCKIPNITSEEWIYTIEREKYLPFGFSPKFGELLKSDNSELYHIHSIYSYSTTLAAKYARKKCLPYIIAPRGSLYETSINSSSVISKYLFNKYILFPDLQNADVIHATCVEEMNQIRNLGITSPIAIIPNSILLPDKMPSISSPSKFRLCYLGRINEIKNLDGLLRAWHLSGLANNREAELVIIGDARLDKEKKYLIELHHLEKGLNIENIVWKGNMFNKDKDIILNSCSYLILPSFSENFGMVVIESLVQGVPVVASKGTPWSSLVDHECGWWINNNIEEMANQIKKLQQTTLDERYNMGLKGQEYVRNNFSTDTVSLKLKILYDWILKKGIKPDFVFTN